jgi:hypothetical protein
MVAILVPQPDETTRDPALDLPAQSRRSATRSHPRPVDLVSVEPLGARSDRRALPDRPTRIRRRRLVALLIAVALVGVIATVGQALLGAAATIEPSPPQPVDAPARPPTVGQTYVVKPGDTLWSIAAAIAPDSDPPPVVDALREQNGGPDLQVGERLTIRTD